MNKKIKSFLLKSFLSISLISAPTLFLSASPNENSSQDQIDWSQKFQDFSIKIEEKFTNLIEKINQEVIDEIGDSFPEVNLYGKKRFYNNLKKYQNEYIQKIKDSLFKNKNLFESNSIEFNYGNNKNEFFKNTLSNQLKNSILNEYFQLFEQRIIGLNEEKATWLTDSNNFSKYNEDYSLIDNQATLDRTPQEEIKIEKILNDIFEGTQQFLAQKYGNDLLKQKEKDLEILKNEINSNNIDFSINNEGLLKSAFELKDSQIEIEYKNPDLKINVMENGISFGDNNLLLETNGKKTDIRIYFALNNAYFFKEKTFDFEMTLEQSRQSEIALQEQEIQNSNAIKIKKSAQNKFNQELKNEDFDIKLLNNNFSININNIMANNDEIVLNYTLELKPYKFTLASFWNNIQENNSIIQNNTYTIKRNKDLTLPLSEEQVDIDLSNKARKISAKNVDNSKLEDYFIFYNQNPNFSYKLLNFEAINDTSGNITFSIKNNKNEQRIYTKKIEGFLSPKELEEAEKIVNDDSASDLNSTIEKLLASKEGMSEEEKIMALSALMGGYFLEDSLKEKIIEISEKLKQDSSFEKLTLDQKVEKLTKEFEDNVSEDILKNEKEFTDMVKKTIEEKIDFAKDFLEKNKNIDSKIMKDNIEKINNISEKLKDKISDSNIKLDETLKYMKDLENELSKIDNIESLEKIIDFALKNTLNVKKYKKMIDIVIMWSIFGISSGIGLISIISLIILSLRKKKILKSKSSLFLMSSALGLTSIAIAVYSIIELLF